MKVFVLTLLFVLLPVTCQPAQLLPAAEINCLAKAIYSESRGEPFIGQVAVAHVVLNRQRAPQFPKTICGVVYQPHQFTDIQKSRPKVESPEWKEAVEIATITYSGLDESPVGDSLYYYAHNIVRPRWASVMKVRARINNHTFLGAPK